jgi:hypothetical protein
LKDVCRTRAKPMSPVRFGKGRHKLITQNLHWLEIREVDGPMQEVWRQGCLC